nr:hypothetical protein MarFTME_317 [Marseillevirus futianmevirus]
MEAQLKCCDCLSSEGIPSFDDCVSQRFSLAKNGKRLELFARKVLFLQIFVQV